MICIPTSLAAASWSVSFQSAFNRWLLLAFLAASVAAIIYLYRAQQRIAARWLIRCLTAIRILLVALVFLLLLGPTLQWSFTRTTAGTLWLLVDRSYSMTVKDMQSAPLEQLRWADALGLLPKDSRTVRLDRDAQELSAMLEQFLRIRPLPGGDPAKTSGALKAFVGSAEKFTQRISADSKLRGRLRPAISRLENFSKLAKDGLSRQEKPSAAPPIPWPQLQTELEAARSALAGIADQVDNEYLAARAGDKAVQEAIANAKELPRNELAMRVLTQKSSTGGESLRDLVPHYQLRIATVSDTTDVASEVRPEQFDAAVKRALAPQGQSTNLAEGLRLIGEQIGTDESAAVVVVSDGRQNTGGDLVEAANALAARGVKLYGLAIGSSQTAADAAIEQTDAPDWIFKDDTVRAAALLRLDGLAGKKVDVELRRNGELVRTEAVTPASNHDMKVLNLQDRPPRVGAYDYEVRIADVPDDVNKENNRQGFAVAVKEDKLAVLMIDDQPRWEFRYLANYLGRDPRINLQMVLFQPARVDAVTPPQPVKASPANPRREAQLLPSGPGEWSAFNLIVLGDVAPQSLPPSEQQAIAAAVRDRGAALLIIAGQKHMPGRYAGSPLADLLPVSMNNDWANVALSQHLRSGFHPRLAPEGQMSLMSQFALDAEANAKFWSAMPLWYWHSELTQVKPSATPLWMMADEPDGAPSLADSADALARARRRCLLATMSVGLGRVMYLASDQTWRMRYVDGENLQDRFWGQVIRWAANSDLPAGGRFVRFGADKPRYVAGEPLLVTVRLLNKDLTPLSGQKFQVIARTADGQKRQLADADVLESADAPGYYRASLAGVPAGSVEIALKGAAAEQLLDDDPDAMQKAVTVQIQPKLTIEQRNLNADRASLGQVAHAGAGVIMDGPYADLLAAQIPEMNRQSDAPQQAGLFTDPGDPNTRKAHWIFLAVFVGLITAEWGLRKWGGLV